MTCCGEDLTCYQDKFVCFHVPELEPSSGESVAAPAPVPELSKPNFCIHSYLNFSANSIEAGSLAI